MTDPAQPTRPAQSQSQPQSRPVPAPRANAATPSVAGAQSPQGPKRSAEVRLARLHLRGGMLPLARAELEQLAGTAGLDVDALADLAEARWRSGDLEGAAEAANAHLTNGGHEPIAELILAEALDRNGHLIDARAHSSRVIERLGNGLDRLFAGEPRSTAWPAVEGDRMYADASEPGRRGLLVSGADMQDGAERHWEPAPLPGQAAARPAGRTQPGQPGGAPGATPVAVPAAGAGGQSIGALMDAGRAAGLELESVEAEIAAGHVDGIADRLALLFGWIARSHLSSCRSPNASSRRCPRPIRGRVVEHVARRHLPRPRSRGRGERGVPGSISRGWAARHQQREHNVTERTLVLIKPDGVQRLLVGRILERYEQRGLKIVGLKLVAVTRDLAERHYAVHRDKPFFKGLVDFITSSPLVALALEGNNAIALCRSINGATRPVDAAPGSIRGDFAIEVGQNLVHASDSAENAQTELALWFGADELHAYERAVDEWVVGPSALAAWPRSPNRAQDAFHRLATFRDTETAFSQPGLAGELQIPSSVGDGPHLEASRRPGDGLRLAARLPGRESLPNDGTRRAPALTVDPIAGSWLSVTFGRSRGSWFMTDSA